MSSSVKNIVKTAKKTSKNIKANPTIKFSVSNLYVIMGMNYFKKFDKILLDVWKSYNYKEYKEFEKNYKDTHKIVPATASSNVQIAELTAKYGINVGNITDASRGSCAKGMIMEQNALIGKVNKGIKGESKKELSAIIKRGFCGKASQENSKKISELECKYNIKINELIIASSDKSKEEKDKYQKEIIEKIDKAIINDKERLAKLIKSHTNTRFGIFQENNAVKLFEKETGKKVKDSQLRFDYHINTINNFEWHLIGKLDGKTDDGSVLEIKNRVNKLFGQVPTYEYPQLMVYMRLADSNKAYMFERYRNDAKPEHGIYEVKYTENYFEETVLPSIYKFQKFFDIFIKSDELKGMVVCGNEADLYSLFKNTN